MHPCAFVTFVMRNDAYVPGALVFAYALKKQGVLADVICLVTPEVSKKARFALSSIFDDVITIEPITIYHPMRHGRQDRPFLFTRFQALRLGKDGDLGKGYEKIVVADADLLPISHYQSLLDLPAPAGIMNESKNHCVSSFLGSYTLKNHHHNSREWHWHHIYRSSPHGFKIPKAMTDRILNDPSNLGINACLYVLHPNMDDYLDIMNDLKDPDIIKQICTYPWPEMQYLTLKYSGLWHNIDLRYASFNGYPKLDILYGTHYAGLKPWKITCDSVNHFAKYDDYQLFFQTYHQMMEDYPMLTTNKKLNHIDQCFVKLMK